MTTAEDILQLYQSFQEHGIRVWLSGGWGMDALLGRQTRPHKDMDIFVLRDDITCLCALLEVSGYHLKELWSENCQTVDREGVEIATAFVLADGAGREVDIHAILIDEQDNITPVWDAAGFIIRQQDLSGEGQINGVKIACLTAEMQVYCHTGYELPEQHIRDLDHLRERFGDSCPPK